MGRIDKVGNVAYRVQQWRDISFELVPDFVLQMCLDGI